MKSRDTIGIDAGATLWKLFRTHEVPQLEVIPTGAVECLQHRIAQWAPHTIGITGAQACLVAAAINSVRFRRVNEFAAWALGAPVLAKLDRVLLPEHYLLVSIGTGTFILEIREDQTRRVSGSTLGGGTLLGLSRLLGCSDSFSDFLTLASHGERSSVDLLVGDIVSSTDDIQLSCDTTASSFGKLDSREPADLAHALIWLIGENVGVLCNAVARLLPTRTIVFGGGLLAGNPILEEVIRQTLADQGNEALFLKNGIFCGALGAAIFADSNDVLDSAV